MCRHSFSLNTQAMRLRRLKHRDRASTAMPAWTRPIMWLQRMLQDQRPNPYVMKELNITYDHIPSPTELALASRFEMSHPPAARRPHSRPPSATLGTTPCHAPTPSHLSSFFLFPSILTPSLLCDRSLTYGMFGGLLVALIVQPFKMWYQSYYNYQDEHLLYLALIEIALLWFMLLTTSCLVGGVRRLVHKARAAREESAAELALNMPPHLSRAEKHLWRVFRQADTDKNGSVDMGEFRKLLLEGHYDFTPEELEIDR